MFVIDPSTTCGDGIPTCNDDYQFGTVVTECVDFTNALQIFWNDGCDGELWVDGEYLASTSSLLRQFFIWLRSPNTTYEVSFVVEGEVVAVESETTSDEDCDAPIESCESNGGNLGWIADGYCDSANNNADCLFDGGDCCPSDCVDEYY